MILRQPSLLSSRLDIVAVDLHSKTHTTYWSIIVPWHCSIFWTCPDIVDVDMTQHTATTTYTAHRPPTSSDARLAAHMALIFDSWTGALPPFSCRKEMKRNDTKRSNAPKAVIFHRMRIFFRTPLEKYSIIPQFSNKRVGKTKQNKIKTKIITSKRTRSSTRTESV